MSRWTFGFVVAFLILTMLLCGLTASAIVAAEKISAAKEVAEVFETNSGQVRQLQLLAHSRLLLQNDENRLQREWRDLQAEAKIQGMTDEIKAKHERLTRMKQNIDSRWTAQNEQERKLLQ